MGSVSVEAVTLGLGAVLLATMIATLVARFAMSRSGAEPAHDLVLYQLAMLAGGPTRVSDTALSYLTWQGLVDVRESTDRLVRIGGPLSLPDLHPVEASILGSITAVGVKPAAAMAAGRQAARDHVAGLEGLTVSPGGVLVSGLAVLVGCGAVVVGAVWWLMATTSGTIGFVPLIALMALVYAAWWVTAGRPRTTASGEAVLERKRSRYDADLQVVAIGVTSLPMQKAMEVIALYGRDALTGGLSSLRKVITGTPPAPVMATTSSLTR